ncbi:MAG: helix-turn-helix transcriptional regulator [Synergistaceae bacterium]|nr:helix-turn-helix transcriptional regulator [Synergistaceae bacterium]
MAGSKKRFSDTEMKIIRLLAKGYSYQDIAEILHYVKATIGNNVRRIGKKLGVSGRFDILRMALIKRIVRIKDLEQDDKE